MRSPASSLVVMDIGDVLVRTVPMAQYRALARSTGLPWLVIRAAIEDGDIVPRFETGRLTSRGFAAAVTAALGCPRLPHEEVYRAWNAVIGGIDPVIAAPAARLASSGRLLLASNTNPVHWRPVRGLLASAGLIAPACLSFRIGLAKPDQRFFASLVSQHRAAGDGAVYIDDQPANVVAASRHGLAGWLHQDRCGTAAYLAALVAGPPGPNGGDTGNADRGVRCPREP